MVRTLTLSAIAKTDACSQESREEVDVDEQMCA